MRRPLLQMNKVGFNYGSRHVVVDASFALWQGTATALIGPNGVGKTTLLRLASGSLQPTCGEIKFDGDPMARLPIRQSARQIAIVPQQLEVPFEYTVEEVVEQGRTPFRSLLGYLTRSDRLAIDRALDLTNTSNLKQRVFNELSGGERQRVKIALGLAQQPRLLLLDEPTQNLDIGRQIELLDLLRQLRRAGITILASIHDLHLIAGNFSAVILLRPSAGLLYGSPDRILERSLIGAAFDCSSSNHPFLNQLPAGRNSH